MIEDESKTFLINSTINLIYSDAEHVYCEISMDFHETLIIAEWDAETSKWANPRLADKSSFECRIDSKDYFCA